MTASLPGTWQSGQDQPSACLFKHDKLLLDISHTNAHNKTLSLDDANAKSLEPE